jgi:hypothetical protein
VSVNDFNKLPAFNKFFKVLSTDVTESGEHYLTGLEAFNYPFYALMYHPEYQLMEFLSDKTFNIVNNPETRAIYENLGLFIYNKFKDEVGMGGAGAAKKKKAAKEEGKRGVHRMAWKMRTKNKRLMSKSYFMF